jgi:AbrB family looped-hinge helix DNA binding protein
MELRFDKAGRVILPKPVRDRLGLRGGSGLEMSETPDVVLPKPLDQEPLMIKQRGLWVQTGRIPAGLDIVQAVRDDREARIQKLAGL